MSQNSSTHQPVLDMPDHEDSVPSEFEDANLEVATESPDSAVGAYANQLMDELFEEVDQALDRGVKLPTEPIQPEYVSLQPIAVPNLVLPPVLVQQPAPLERTDDALDLATLNAEAVEEAEQRRGTTTSFDGLLLAAACASLVATAIVWFALENRLQQQTATPADAPVLTAEQGQAAADQTFADYVKRSLDRIARDTAASRTTAAQPAPATNGAAPSTADTTVAAAPPTVLERVYIPVYQPPQLFNQLPSGTTQPAPSVTAPAPVASAPSPTAPQNIAAAPNTAPSPSHVLIGVLELGDRSAALFEINGTPQRVYIGEGIGSSGWTLVSIANQEAIVRRNGEVRSIYVGQVF